MKRKMNEKKTAVEMIYGKNLRKAEEELERLSQEESKDFEAIYRLIDRSAIYKFGIEILISGNLRSTEEIRNEILKKFHIPIFRTEKTKQLSSQKRTESIERIKIHEKKLEELSKKMPLNLSRILNLINLIGHYKATDEFQFQEIKQELCEKHNIPYIEHEHTLPFYQLYIHPPQKSHYKYIDHSFKSYLLAGTILSLSDLFRIFS